MKNRFTILIAVILVIASGCSKDDKSSVINNADIVGKWYVTHMESEGRWVDVKTSCLNGMYAEFKSDNTYNSYESCPKENYTGIYNRSGHLITCKVGGATVLYKILELSGNSATLELTMDGDSIKMKAVRK